MVANESTDVWNFIKRSKEDEMRTQMRTLTLLLAVVATGATAYAEHKISVPINSVGSSTAPDMFTADSTAFLQAENTALMMCRGLPIEIFRTSDQCLAAQDGEGNAQWSCSVSVVLWCTLNTR